LNIIL